MYRFFISLIFIFLVFANNTPVRAQDDTFGPICDLTTPGVTCSPTATSAPTATCAPNVTCAPTATSAPEQPTTLPELPIAGSIEPIFVLVLISGVFTLGGITNLISSHTQPEQK